MHRQELAGSTHGPLGAPTRAVGIPARALGLAVGVPACALGLAVGIPARALGLAVGIPACALGTSADRRSSLFGGTREVCSRRRQDPGVCKSGAPVHHERADAGY